jgi:hypothetical protein
LIAVTVALRPGGIGRHALDRAALQVLDEDIPVIIAVAGHQVAGVALEDHGAALGGELGVEAATVALHPGGIGRHALDRPALQVLDEEVFGTIAVAGDQIAGQAHEEHAVAVGGEPGVFATIVALHPGGIGRHALDCPALQILDEDILGAIAVASYQVAGFAVEEHGAAVGGDLGVVAATIALHPAGIGRYAQRVERRRLIHHVARVIDDIAVVAQPTLEQVGARAAIQDVVSGPPDQRVVAGQAQQLIVAGAADQRVGQDVVATAAVVADDQARAVGKDDVAGGERGQADGRGQVEGDRPGPSG